MHSVDFVRQLIVLNVSRFRIFGPPASSRVQGEESVVCMTGIRFLHGITGWLRGIQCDQRLMELLGAPPTLAYYVYLGHSPRGQCQIFTVTGRLDSCTLVVAIVGGQLINPLQALNRLAVPKA